MGYRVRDVVVVYHRVMMVCCSVKDEVVMCYCVKNVEEMVWYRVRDVVCYNVKEMLIACYRIRDVVVVCCNVGTVLQCH